MPKRKTKDDWLQAALRVLETEGIDAVTVERLARELDISRSGFYWHFQDRHDLKAHLLDYWAHEYNEIIANNPELKALEPRERLGRAMQMIHDFELGRLDLQIRSWARNDATAEAALRRVTDMRLGYMRDSLRELGFSGDDLMVRSRLIVAYFSSEPSLFEPVGERRHRRLQRRILDLLTR